VIPHATCFSFHYFSLIQFPLATPSGNGSDTCLSSRIAIDRAFDEPEQETFSCKRSARPRVSICWLKGTTQVNRGQVKSAETELKGEVYEAVFQTARYSKYSDIEFARFRRRNRSGANVQRTSDGR
jgi:transcription elongation factor Elf1